MKIIQIEEQDIDMMPSLEQSDIGKWCIIVSGSFFGFFDTQAEAEAFLKEV